MTNIKRVKTVVDMFNLQLQKVEKRECTTPVQVPPPDASLLQQVLPQRMNYFQVRLHELLEEAAVAGVVITVENQLDPEDIDPVTNAPRTGMGAYMSVGSVRPSYRFARLFMDEAQRLKEAAKNE